MRRTKQEVLKIYQEYLQGVQQTVLNKKYNTDTYYLFKKYNLLCRTPGESRIKFRHTSIKLNYNFEKITNSEEAYIVGIFLADGHVGKTQLGLRLKKSDINIIQKIKNYFSKDITLQQDETTVGFVVSSYQACENAIKLGISRHKTQKEFIIPKMDDKYLSDFIRGYFDGDGTIFKCNNKYLKSNICSPTIQILENIQTILKNNNISSTINKESRIGKIQKILDREYISTMDMYRLYIRKKEDLQRFYYFLYNNSNFYLERKKEVFDNNFYMLKKLK